MYLSQYHGFVHDHSSWLDIHVLIINSHGFGDRKPLLSTLRILFGLSQELTLSDHFVIKVPGYRVATMHLLPLRGGITVCSMVTGRLAGAPDLYVCKYFGVGCCIYIL